MVASDHVNYRQIVLSLPAEKGLPTFIVDILFPIKAFGAIFQVAIIEVYGPHNTLVSQVAHEQLQSDQGKHTQAEHCQNHDI